MGSTRVPARARHCWGGVQSFDSDFRVKLAVLMQGPYKRIFILTILADTPILVADFVKTEPRFLYD